MFVSIFYSTVALFCDVVSKIVSISIKVLATSAQTKIILWYF